MPLSECFHTQLLNGLVAMGQLGGKTLNTADAFLHLNALWAFTLRDRSVIAQSQPFLRSIVLPSMVYSLT
ncbi:MAG: hypothetical protein HUU01_08225 [Saprospiraceae bacterium]|nr:hypothetical protein [Saprospiraceae bacterium]